MTVSDAWRRHGHRDRRARRCGGARGSMRSRERVWEEFETFEAMPDWFGIGHTLVEYEPRVGAYVRDRCRRGQSESSSGTCRPSTLRPSSRSSRTGWVTGGRPRAHHVPAQGVGRGNVGRAVPPRFRAVRRAHCPRRVASWVRGRVDHAAARDAARPCPRLIRTPRWPIRPDGRSSICSASSRARSGGDHGPVLAHQPARGVEAPACAPRRQARDRRGAGLEWRYQLDPQPLADIYFGWLRLRSDVGRKPRAAEAPSRGETAWAPSRSRVSSLPASTQATSTASAAS